MTPEQEITARLREDTFFLARYILGYTRLDPDVHGEWGRRLDYQPARRRLILRPRKTYKTTFYTISYAIRRLIANPNLRILLVNAVETNAIGFLREIKGHCERNARFRDLVGDWMSDKWNEGGINIRPRTRPAKELSINVCGYGSTLVSAHYDLMIFDDLVNNRDRASSLARRDKIQFFQDAISLLDEGGEILVVGTPWHPDDLYHYIREVLNPSLTPRDRYVVEAEGAYLPDGVTPRYPNILPEETLQEIRLTLPAADFAAQYLIDPQPVGTAMFDLSQMVTFPFAGVAAYPSIVGFCDPALGRSNLGCYSAVVTVGVDPAHGTLDILDADLQRIPPDALLALIAQKHAYYRYARFGIEDNNFQERLVADLRSQRTTYLPVEGVSHRTDKTGRIGTLQPLFARGQLRVAEDWRTRYPLLIDQLLGCQLDTLPAYVDGPDALEGAVTLASRYLRPMQDVDIPEDPAYGGGSCRWGRRLTRQEQEDYGYIEDPFYAETGV
jgi:predicted phage terminase large subunit-like protein